ncbi:GNAT family N-acetyltransferase [Paraliomyxa miuraensis]|uniref:GNAT family N-acetyltransferase n=1 Tax=Paraliomyxa miuraensis TaxID=376150 RepID=UPI00225A3AB0|nr:GNAT family N-acetyltransferase [Paraliomyxa miuraensis]MCX4247433.1 GNAT family N-acetyltransferase [Paraliomyxa miuraensis]
MPLPLLTPRLRIRGPEPDDFEALFEGIWSRPEVMRFVGPPRSRTLAAERFAWSRELFQRTGMALWTVERRSDGAILGDCGVIPLEGLGPQIELGYRLRRSVWGQGLATEAAAAALSHAMAPEAEGGLGLSRVVAVVDPDHTASRRVLEKLGLRYVGLTAAHYETTSAFYETDPQK